MKELFSKLRRSVLNFQNIVFDKDPKDPTAEIQVIDFGLATRFLSDQYKTMTARVGTLYSMAPQVLQGVYDAKCDMYVESKILSSVPLIQPCSLLTIPYPDGPLG